MELQIQELRNSIMEEVILKNYKLLQFVENEMKQLKEENAHLRKEIKLLKDDNTNFKDEIKLLKEENKINKNLFCSDIQNIQDTVENTMIIGYDILYKPISFNVDKAHLIPSFKECIDLSEQLLRKSDCSIIMSTNVFKHINKYNNFKTFHIDGLYMLKMVDENFKKIYLVETEQNYQNNFQMIKDKIQTEQTDWFSHWNFWYNKPNLKILINILNECNINLLCNSDSLQCQIMDLPPKIKNHGFGFKKK
jgi:hypothetical protein